MFGGEPLFEALAADLDGVLAAFDGAIDDEFVEVTNDRKKKRDSSGDQLYASFANKMALLSPESRPSKRQRTGEYSNPDSFEEQVTFALLYDDEQMFMAAIHRPDADLSLAMDRAAVNFESSEFVDMILAHPQYELDPVSEGLLINCYGEKLDLLRYLKMGAVDKLYEWLDAFGLDSGGLVDWIFEMAVRMSSLQATRLTLQWALSINLDISDLKTLPVALRVLSSTELTDAILQQIIQNLQHIHS